VVERGQTGEHISDENSCPFAIGSEKNDIFKKPKKVDISKSTCPFFVIFCGVVQFVMYYNPVVIAGFKCAQLIF